jgi:hypothetical protein
MKNTILHMSCACWLNRATDRHSGFVITLLHIKPNSTFGEHRVLSLNYVSVNKINSLNSLYILLYNTNALPYKLIVNTS